MDGYQWALDHHGRWTRPPPRPRTRRRRRVSAVGSGRRGPAWSTARTATRSSISFKPTRLAGSPTRRYDYGRHQGPVDHRTSARPTTRGRRRDDHRFSASLRRRQRDWRRRRRRRLQTRRSTGRRRSPNDDLQPSRPTVTATGESVSVIVDPGTRASTGTSLPRTCWATTRTSEAVGGRRRHRRYVGSQDNNIVVVDIDPPSIASATTGVQLWTRPMTTAVAKMSDRQPERPSGRSAIAARLRRRGRRTERDHHRRLGLPRGRRQASSRTSRTWSGTKTCPRWCSSPSRTISRATTSPTVRVVGPVEDTAGNSQGTGERSRPRTASRRCCRSASTARPERDQRRP